MEKFTELSDSVYSTFKIEVLDKCFSSVKYNNIRKRRLDYNNHKSLYDYEISKTPCEESSFPGHLDRRIEIAYNNLAMLSTLDKNRYSAYYSRIRPLIDNAKKKLEAKAYNEPHSSIWNFRERMCEDYENNIKPL